MNRTVACPYCSGRVVERTLPVHLDSCPAAPTWLSIDQMLEALGSRLRAGR